jgi:SsrA-binding protein
MATAAKRSPTIAENRRAFHEYHILERFETGIALTGTEVKSLRMGRANLSDSFARIDDGEVWLHHMHVSPYTHGNRYNVDPMRPRKLLLKRMEISRLIGKTKEQGLTLIPLKLYWHGDWAKVELGLAKGKQLYDKRETIAAKSAKRDIERALKERSKG